MTEVSEVRNLVSCFCALITSCTTLLVLYCKEKTKDISNINIYIYTHMRVYDNMKDRYTQTHNIYTNIFLSRLLSVIAVVTAVNQKLGSGQTYPDTI